MPRVTITVPDKTPQPYRFQLDRGSVTLGRGSDNDIAIDCPSVSVKHAEMRRIKGGYELRDLGSTNGIKLDGERHPVIALRTGMSARLGDVAFDFILSDEELETLAREKSAADEDVADAGRSEGEPVQDSGDGDRGEPAGVSSSGGLGMIVLFLILAAAAFFAGMAVRFQKDTGGSLIDAIRARPASTGAPASAAPAPADPAPAGER